MKPYDTSFAPYIGITDFRTRQQTKEMMFFFDGIANGLIPHKLMIGVMMSYKTLHGQPTKWGPAFPTNDEVADIFIQHPLAFNTLHYADYTSTDVFNSLSEAIRLGGIDIDALQLDMVWPDAGEIANAVHASRKRISVILQIGKNALEDVGDDLRALGKDMPPQEMIVRLEDYGDVIDGVLIDRSMGQGKAMDAEVLRPYVDAVYEHLPNLRVAVAGGLSAPTMDTVEPLVSKFPDISIDAQGRLRRSGNALDPIDWELARAYVQEATKLFAKYQPVS